MLTEHYGIMVFLMAAAGAHANLFDSMLGRTIPVPWWRVALLVVPLLLIPCGDFIASEARSRSWRRGALWTTTIGAVVHLAIDLACVSNAQLIRQSPALSAGCVLAMISVAVVLRSAVRALVADELVQYPRMFADFRAAPRNIGLRIEREAWLWGGTSIALSLVSMSFVVAALTALVRRPDEWWTVTKGALFFTLCTAAAVHTGWTRRRSLLRAFEA